jgi:colanic acid/amylovoran biosynthesis glycosyltransferase
VSTARTVVIWRSVLLPGSETFVRHHGEALTRWRPSYLGAVSVDSPLTRDTDVVAFPDTPDGRCGWLLLRLTGRSAKLRDLLARARPDLVHAHFGGDGRLISRAAAELGVPLVITLHGIDVTGQADRPGVRGARHRRHLRTAFRRAALILAVSGPIRDRAIALGADPAKVRVHHTGVPLPAPAPARPLPAPAPARPESAPARPESAPARPESAPARPESAPARPESKGSDVVFVGRFVDKKGVDDLLEAVALLADRRPRVLLIGDGPLLEPMRALADRLGVDATFLGPQDPSVVARCMAGSRILAAPSRTATDGDTEGLPTTILEAAGLGVPAVATVHSGIPEAVVHGETGLLGPERDRPALAAHLRRLLDDDALRILMGKRAADHVRAHFDLAVQTRRLEDLYGTVAGPAG